MIRYVWYKSYLVIPCERVKLTEYLKGGGLRGPWVSTGVRKYVGTVLIYYNHNFFQNHKVIHILFGIVYIAAATYIWFVTKTTLKNVDGVFVRAWQVLGEWVSNFCSWWMGRGNWPVGQQVNPLASALTYSPNLTHWPTGWPVGQPLIIGGWVITAPESKRWWTLSSVDQGN